MGIVDVSAIGRSTLFGRLLRAPLRLIPARASLPVIQGPLRGAKWIVGSSTHGCWLGSYEREKQVLLARLLSAGMTMYDVGANVGFYTLLAARRVAPAGRVVAFEPLARNIDYLQRHIVDNRCDNVKVMPIALSDTKGTTRFAPGEGPSEGFLSDEGSLVVETDTIDRLVADAVIGPPDLMKIDVEGAEFRVLRGARSVLAGYRPVILFATHGDRVRAVCHAFLAELGYRIEPIGTPDPEEADEFIAEPSEGSIP